MELLLAEHAEEDIFGEDVLEEHLPHVRLRDVGADGLAAELEEGGGRLLVARAAGLRLNNGAAKVLQDLGRSVLNCDQAWRNSSICGSS